MKIEMRRESEDLQREREGFTWQFLSLSLDFYHPPHGRRGSRQERERALPPSHHALRERKET
jgi:hypothetical protein